MFSSRCRAAIALCAALWISSQMVAQTSKVATQPRAVPTHVYLEAQFGQVKHGSEPAIRNVVSTVFDGAGIPKAVYSSFGFSDRIVQAELKYRQGNHPAVHQTDIVNAVNNLANSLGAPAWAHTNTQEVTKMRMWMLVLYPQTIASTTPVQPNGKFELLSDNMSPLEATFIATTLIEQKLWNSMYQFTDSERSSMAHTSDAAIQKLSGQRGAQLKAAIQGGTQGHSLRDLLHTADGFFTDLRIDPVASPLVSSVKASPEVR